MLFYYNLSKNKYYGFLVSYKWYLQTYYIAGNMGIKWCKYIDLCLVIQHFDGLGLKEIRHTFPLGVKLALDEVNILGLNGDSKSELAELRDVFLEDYCGVKLTFHFDTAAKKQLEDAESLAFWNQKVGKSLFILQGPDTRPLLIFLHFQYPRALVPETQRKWGRWKKKMIF